MRILLFTSSYAPRRGGLETVTRRLAREFSSAGHQVRVATNRYPRSLQAQESIDGIEVHRQLYPALLPMPEKRTRRQRLQALASVLLAPVAIARLLTYTRRMQPDVVNIHYFSGPTLYMLLVARMCRIPVILSFHGSDLPTVPYPGNYRWPVRWACRHVQALTVCSEDMHMHLNSLMRGESNAIVAHNGVDVPRMPESETNQSHGAMLIISRLTDKKGVDVAIRSVALLRARHGDVELTVAGDGPLRTELKRLACGLKVQSLVHFLGSVPPERVPELLRQARFLVVPSYWEAFGVVCLEAMAAGKAVIASRAGGPQEIVVDGVTGRLVEPGDPEALAEAMSSLIDHPDVAEAMGKRGQARAEHHFTWEGTAGRYMTAFERALAPHLAQGAVRGQEVG